MSKLRPGTRHLRHKGGPATEREAIEKLKASGRHETLALMAVRLVGEFPGSTVNELLHHATPGTIEHSFRPRFHELVEAGLILVGPVKECSIRRSNMLTYLPVPIEPQATFSFTTQGPKRKPPRSRRVWPQ